MSEPTTPEPVRKAPGQPPEAEVFTEAELARWFQLSPRTARRLRAGGDWPPHIRRGGRILYERAAVLRWLEER